MKITGNILRLPSSCSDIITSLQVEIQSRSVGRRTKNLAKLDIDQSGSFDYIHEAEVHGSIYILIQYISKEGKLTLVKEFGPYCNQEEINVQHYFEPKGHVVWYQFINTQIQKVIADGSLSKVEPKDYELLACQGCISVADIKELVQSDKLRTTLINATKKCLRESEKAATKDKVNIHFYRQQIAAFRWLLTSNDIEEALFALIKGNLDQKLSLLLSHSTKALQSMLSEATLAKRIALKPNDAKQMALAFSYVRDCMISNANYDDGFYDAKLIHLSSFDYLTKRIILDHSLDKGSLIDAIDTLNESQLASASKRGKLLKTNLSENEIQDEFSSIIWLDKMIGRFPPLLETLLPDFYQQNWDDSQLISISEEKWVGIIESHKGEFKYPKQYNEMDTPMKSYASDIHDRLANSNPTKKISSLLNDSQVPGRTTLKRILSKTKDFNILSTAISRHFNVVEKPEESNQVTESQYKKLQEFQRTVKLAGGVKELKIVEALYLTGFTSSARIMNRGRHEFKLAMSEYEVRGPQINRIYCRARGNWDLSTELASQYIKYESGQSPLPPSLESEKEGVNTSSQDNLRRVARLSSNNIPDLESLFGSIDSCNCKHCQSVYSPSAYLTDLLHWMSSEVVCQDTNLSAYQALDKRRPDIKYIQLNCKNSNTVLPYIDLVNELLLAYIPGTPNVSLLRDLQTTRSSDELVNRPEHIDHNGFEYGKGELRKATINWTLPYDLDWDRSIHYLEALGVQSWQLGEALGISIEEKWWANERLGLVSYQHGATGSIQYLDWDILTDNGSSTVWNNYYNQSQPNTVRELLKISGLTFEEFKSLLKIEFIVQSSGFTYSPKDSCELNEMVLSNFTADVALRLMKFVKLHIRTGLTFQELDFIFNTFSVTEIDDAVLQLLAKLLDISHKYNWNIQLLLCLKSELPISSSTLGDYEINTNYEERFLVDGLSKSLFDKSRLDLSEDINDLTDEELKTIASQYNMEVEVFNHFKGLRTTWDLATVSFLLKAEFLVTASNLRFEEFIYVLSENHASTINSIHHVDDFYIFINNCKKIEGLSIPLTQVKEMLGGTGEWALNLSSIDLSNLYGEDLQAAYDDYNNSLPDPSTTSLPDQKPVLITHLSHLLSLDEFVVGSIINSISFPDPIDKIVLFVRSYRIIKRAALLSIETGLDLIDLYNSDTHLLSQLIPPGHTFDRFSWLKEYFNSPIFEEVCNIIWLKKRKEQSTFYNIPQHDYFSITDSLLQLSTPTNTTIGNRANTLHGLITSGPFSEISSNALKDLFRKAFSIGQSKELFDLINLSESILNVSENLVTSVNETWNLVFRNQNLSGPTDQNALSRSWTLLQLSIDNLNGDGISAKQVEDKIRIRLRDHLLAYHLFNSGLNFENSNAVFAYYLIDPEMDVCMKTSRIKLALSSTQLLMHRAIMGLESDLCPSTDNVKEWEWRQNYRVWEANRKVFLYAENWVDPTLRIEKSELFDALEDAILQDEVTTENCEKAVSDYLLGLNKIARLDIRAVHTEVVNEQNGSEVLHVFGRTFTTPHEYYYRSRDVNKKWSPWEKLELDIEGDHLIPTVFNRKLYLIWPMFIEKEHRKIKRMIDGEEQNAPYFEIKLCYSKLEFGKWSSKKVFDATLFAGHYGGIGCFNNIKRKLGRDVPLGIVDYETTVNSFATYGITGTITQQVPVIGPLETHNGNLVLSNSNFADYAKVSLDKDDFYFWPQLRGNDLVIHVRRGFHEDWDDWHYSYSEMAYEDSFKISACDESAEVIHPIVVENDTQKRFLARPFNTVPSYNRMTQGMDGWQADHLVPGVYVKNQVTHGNGSVKILSKSETVYNLTYPIENKHSMLNLPFFLTDKRHTLFFERHRERVCKKVWLEENPNSPYEYYLAVYEDRTSQKYSVQSHKHPYVCLMLSEFNKSGFKGLYQSNIPWLNRQQADVQFFNNDYGPVPVWIHSNHPTDTFDFNHLSPYGIYNMEMFFHIPSLVARQLKSNGKYSDAIKWLQFIFDPTSREMHLGVDRFWNIKPFFENISNSSIQALLALLGAGPLSPDQEQERQSMLAQIEAWEENPFEPHRIAEMRLRTYMLWTVYEYVDVLIEWGDSLFSQDTIESINEATNLYILASEILGRRPLKIDKPGLVNDYSYDDIRNGLDDFSNTIENLENEIPNYNPSICCEDDRTNFQNQSLPDLFFCIPDNPKVLEMWDRVEDRLFKIRHCMNIEGQVRDLALFQPPIDPGLLVRARAMGIEIGDLLADLNSPDPIYRFSYLVQKANEYTNELKSLSSQLLSALEKKDGEELSQIRQLHERNILKATKNIRKLQLEEAKYGLKSLEHGKKLIEIRLDEYSGREYKNRREDKAIKHTKKSEGFMYAEQGASVVAAALKPIPDVNAGITSFIHVSGGEKLSEVAKTVGLGFGIVSSVFRNKASMSLTLGGYDRRQEDWDFQVKTAKEELNQVDKQILAAEIRIALAEKELANHELQMEQSAEVYDYLRNKFTNEKLYGWMSTELSKLSHSAFKLALDVAKQAQKAYEKEIGNNPTIIETGYWDGTKKGLLAGEKLSLQLKALDDAYMKNDKRKFELNKSISLRLLDPQALVNLIEHKYCKVKLEAKLFDLEFHGKKLNEIKIRSLSVSIPSVTGPYISTNVKLRCDTEEMITSSGINDTGVFDANPGQPKYLPFEYKIIDDTELEIMLPEKVEFDESTISDVVLNINYQAINDDGTDTSNSVTQNTPVNEEYLLMSWRHDFLLEWQNLISTGSAPIIDASWLENRIPYKYQIIGLGGDSFDEGLSRVLTYDSSGNPELDSLVLNDLSINGSNEVVVGTSKVEDVWLMFKISIPGS